MVGQVESECGWLALVWKEGRWLSYAFTRWSLGHVTIAAYLSREVDVSLK